MLIVVLPADTGWNVEVPLVAPALKVTGVVMVPTAVLELLVVTLTGAAPGRTPCARPVGANEPASSIEGAMVTAESPLALLLILPLVMTNPEGCRPTVVVPSLKPSAFAVSVTLPEFAKP